MDMTMSAFQARVSRNARRERRPLTCTFEITPTCNLRCHFCYVALDPYKGPYLSTEQVGQILDTLRDAGVLWLTLTGGEIFSRRDFPEIYRHARRNGFLVTLFSNGTLVTERIAGMLAEDPPFSMEVSIYGADAEHYEGTTGIPGSFTRFERGIRLLQEAGVPLVLKTPVSKLTEDHVPALRAWCAARGLPFKVDLTLDVRHDGGQQPAVYRIEPRRMARLVDQIAAIGPAGRAEDVRQTVLPEPRPRSGMPLPECADVDASRAGELYTCGAGRTAFFIDGLGNASHCVIDRDPAFPMLSMPWQEIWSRMGDWVTQPLPSDAPCNGCSLRSSCGNCPARSRLATGSPYRKDHYFCDITHLEHGLEPAPRVPELHPPRPLGACVA